jgi:hypothetical protein
MSMLYYKVKPECCGWFGRRTLYAGELETCPPTIYRLEYEFRSWPADHLLEVNCQFIATQELINALSALSPKVSGVHYEAVTATNTLEMRRERPGVEMPEYKWMKVTGQAGRDDFFVAKDHHLVISERILAAIEKKISASHISLYVDEKTSSV